MKVNKKSTCGECNCSAENVLEANIEPLNNNNFITKDCNVVLSRLDTSAELLKMTLKYSAGHKIKDGHVKVLPGMEKRKCLINENVSNNKQLNEKKIEEKRNIEDMLPSILSSSHKKSSLKQFFERVPKKVRFKMPIAKYRIIEPKKKKITKKLLIILAKCDNIDKRKLRNNS